MVNELLVNVVNSILGSGKRTARGNQSYSCPFCHHHKPKLEINFTENKNGDNPWNCWVCGKKGKKLLTLFKQIDVSPEILSQLKTLTKSNSYEEDISINNIVELPKEYKKFSNDIISKHALHYLKKRNITKQDILKYDIGYCDYGLYKNMIIVPSYDNTGKLNYFTARSFEEDPFIKYRNPDVSRDIIPCRRSSASPPPNGSHHVGPCGPIQWDLSRPPTRARVRWKDFREERAGKGRGSRRCKEPTLRLPTIIKTAAPAAPGSPSTAPARPYGPLWRERDARGLHARNGRQRRADQPGQNAQKPRGGQNVGFCLEVMALSFPAPGRRKSPVKSYASIYQGARRARARPRASGAAARAARCRSGTRQALRRSSPPQPRAAAQTASPCPPTRPARGRQSAWTIRSGPRCPGQRSAPGQPRQREPPAPDRRTEPWAWRQRAAEGPASPCGRF